MKTTLCSLSWLHLSLVLAVMSLQMPASSAAAESRRAYSTNLADKAECEKQLNKIFEAIQEYQRQKGKLPDWLSDLEPEFISDPKGVICPVVLRTGDLKSWRKGILDVVLSDVRTSYSYEFCLSNVPPRQWAGSAKTYREYKQRQMEKLGPIVPIVRCMAHRPMLNLAVGGKIFESGLYWEEMCHLPQADLQPGPLFAAIEPLAPGIPPRPTGADASLLDMTSHYNLSLNDTRIPHRPAYSLAPLDAGIRELHGTKFDARGVLQLAGKELGPPFPEAVPGIAVRRACKAIHFLHGAVFATPLGTKVGDFVVHYSDGQMEEIPLLYGKDVEDVWFDPAAAELPGIKPVWREIGPDGKGVRLYRLTWRNRRHPVIVESVDFRSVRTLSAPFLVAITVDRE